MTLMRRSSASLTAALNYELDAMRDERLAQARATKAARHAEALARARAQDEARIAKAKASNNATPERNAHVAEPLRAILNVRGVRP